MEQTTNRAGLPAKDLMAFLLESGTPVQTLRRLGDWLATQQEPTAEALYRHMEATDVTEGTRRKAGVWIWGRGHKVREELDLSPADELQRLQAENKQLQTTLRTLEDDCTNLRREGKQLTEELAKLGWTPRSRGPTPLAAQAPQPATAGNQRK